MGSKFVNEELFTNNTTYNTEDESENERNKDEIIIGDSDKIEEIEVFINNLYYIKKNAFILKLFDYKISYFPFFFFLQ